MSNPFVSSSSFAESGSTQVEVHHQLGHDGDAPPLASGVVNGSTQLPLDHSSADNGGSVGGPGTATGSWVQFEESGGSETTATATASAQQQASQTTTEGADVHLQTPPRCENSSSSAPQGGNDGFSSISANSAGGADQKEPLADSNHFATIELSHSIEISHPQSATHLKQQQQQQQPPSSSATAGGHLLKVVNTSPGAVPSSSSSASPPSFSSSISLPKSPTPSLTAAAGSATGALPPASSALSHFANGDIIVTLLPLNEGWDWITPARFKAHLVPEELMAQSLTLTVEDYVTTMSVLFSDYRFNLYIIFHKRVLGLWISLSILLLLCLLFSGWTGVALFTGGLLWLLLNSLAIFAVIYIKQKLYRMLEEALAQVNAVLSKHNVFLGLDDRGRYSCHKVELVFVYFDAKYCIKFLQDMINNSEEQVNSSSRSAGSVRLNNSNSVQQQQMDHSSAMLTLSNTLQCIDTSDIIITGSTPRKLSQKEKYADRLLLRYSQRWIREYHRERLELTSRQPQQQQQQSGTGSNGTSQSGAVMMMNNQQPHPTTAAASAVTTSSSSSSSSAAAPITSSCSIAMAARHCRGHKCLCQYIEEHLRYKPVTTCSMLGELFRS